MEPKDLQSEELLIQEIIASEYRFKYFAKRTEGAEKQRKVPRMNGGKHEKQRKVSRMNGGKQNVILTGIHAYEAPPKRPQRVNPTATSSIYL